MAERMTAEKLAEISAAIEKLCSQMTDLDKKIVADIRFCMRTIQDDSPRELNQAVQHGNRQLKETAYFANRTTKRNSAGVREVAETCRNLGLEHPNQKVRGLMRRAEHSARGAEHEAEEAHSEITLAEKNIAEGVSAAEEVEEQGQELLYLEDEVGVPAAVASITKLLLRVHNAEEAGLLAGAMKKLMEAQKLAAKLEADVRRVEKGAGHVRALLAKQSKLFADAEALVKAKAEGRTRSAEAHSVRNSELLALATEGLLTWRRGQERRLKEAEVTEKTKLAKALAKRIKSHSDALKKMKSDEKQAKKAAAEAAEVLLDSRPELLGPCRCGRRWDCSECASKAVKATHESGAPSLVKFAKRPGIVVESRLGPGLYEPHKADAVRFPCVEDKACELSRSYSHMPFPGEQHHPATAWARSLRPHAYSGGTIHPRHTAVRELARKTEHLFTGKNGLAVSFSKEIGGVVPRLQQFGDASSHAQQGSSALSGADVGSVVNGSSAGGGGGGLLGEKSGVKILTLLGGGAAVVASSVASVVAAKAAASASSAPSSALVVPKSPPQGHRGATGSTGGNGSVASSSSSTKSGLKPGAAGKGAGGKEAQLLLSANAQKREQALAVLRRHLKNGGESIVPSKEFKNLLRKAGLKNPEVSPWLHGAPADVSLGTNFEADCYERPAFICIGSKSHLVNSPRWRPGPCS
mmetsp:Transcript_57984/g.109238  ORF Transcript_57984/g.109238 Transcript_57984/m.109238 type:complete len:694 (-) Transcript_57984:236-2317(-)